jgi:hypothetical protein
MTDKEFLTAVLAEIADEDRWTQGFYFAEASGMPVEAAQAECKCWTGAAIVVMAREVGLSLERIGHNAKRLLVEAERAHAGAFTAMLSAIVEVMPDSAADIGLPTTMVPRFTDAAYIAEFNDGNAHADVVRVTQHAIAAL